MAGHKELIKKLAEDDALRQQLLDTPTRELEAVRNAGLEPPDRHDVLREVAGGVDTGESVWIGAGVVGGVSAAAAAATAAVVGPSPPSRGSMDIEQVRDAEMAGHKELIENLAEDDLLRRQILATPTGEGKLEVVRNAGLEVPDHRDVLRKVAGGVDTGEGEPVVSPGVGGVSAATAATAAVI